MKIDKSSSSLFCVAVIGLSTAASISVVGADLTTTINSGVVSQYMFRGMRLGGSAWQSSAEAAWKGFGAGVWTSVPIANRVPGVSDPEIDPYGYYTITINDKLNIVPGFSVYTYPEADTTAGFYKATFEPYVGVNYTVVGITLTPKVYYDVVLEGPTFELTVAYAVPLKKLHTSLNFSGAIGTYFWDDSVKDATPKVQNRGSYCQAGVTVPFQISKAVKLTFGAGYVQGFDNAYKTPGVANVDNLLATGRFVGSAAISLSF